MPLADDFIHETEGDPGTWKTHFWLVKGKGEERDKSGVWD